MEIKQSMYKTASAQLRTMTSEKNTTSLAQRPESTKNLKYDYRSS
jgi:hypothetical protein